MIVLRDQLKESATSFFNMLSTFAHKAQMSGHYDRGWSPVLIQFRKGDKFDWTKAYYAIDTSDGWFRIDHTSATRLGAAYGLMIRSFKITTPMGSLKQHYTGVKFNASRPGDHDPIIDLKGMVTYLPTAEDTEDPGKYETNPISVWLDTEFVLQAYGGDPVPCLRDLNAYIEANKASWIP